MSDAGRSVLVDQHRAHYRTGGTHADHGAPTLVLVHGAGMDGTVWSQQTRFLGSRGVNAVAVDLPGHGHSEGAPLSSVPSMADWLARFCNELHVDSVTLAGHSMGTFIALEVANSFPELVRAVALFGTATAMPVHPELLAAAEEDLARAAALMNGWSHAADSRIGLNPTPGLWMTGGFQALVERSAPGVLSTDLQACAAYEDAQARAATLPCEALVVIGKQDKMTPARSSQAMAQAMVRSPKVEVIELPNAGHMTLTEEPRVVREALLSLVTTNR